MSNTDKSDTSGAFVSGEDFKALIEEEKVVYTSKNSARDKSLTQEYESLDNEWDIDLSLGEEVYLSSNENVQILDKNETISIDPGEFALLITEEKVDVPPDKAAFISLKFRHALKGLINISGFHVDPNYKGRIVFSVYNAGPSRTVLRRGEAVFMIVFAKLTEPIDATNRDDGEFQEIERIESDMMSGLQGRTASLESLDQTVSDLQRRVRILTVILTGIIVSILGFAITQSII